MTSTLDATAAGMDAYHSPARYLELICHLGNYSPLLVAVSSQDAAQLQQLRTAVVAQHQTTSVVIALAANQLGSSALLTGLVAQQLGIQSLPADEVSAREVLLEFARRRAEESDPAIVIIDQAEQLSDDMLAAIGQLALMASHAISFCLFGLKGFDSQLREGPTAAPVYRIQLDTMTADDASAAFDDLEFDFPGQLDELELPDDFDADLVELSADARDSQHLHAAPAHSAKASSEPLSGADEELLASLKAASAKVTEQALDSAASDKAASHKVASHKAIKSKSLQGRLKAMMAGFSMPQGKASIKPLYLILPSVALLTLLALGWLYSSEEQQAVEVTQLEIPDVVRSSGTSSVVAGSNRGIEATAGSNDSASSSTSTINKGDNGSLNTSSEPTLPSADTPAAIADTVASESEQPPVAAVAQQKASEQATTDVAVVSEKSPESSETVVNVPEEATASGSAYPAWLMSGDGWGVQLIGTSDQAGAVAYVERWQQSAADHLLWYRTERNGKPWFVVLGGEFKTREQATNWASALPAKMKNGTPWVRKLGAVRPQIEFN